jgi:hydroxypyruvate reductase
VLQRHGIEVSAAVRGVLDNPDAEEPGLARDDGRDRFEVVASGMTALLAAGHWCREHGIKPLVLGDRLEDDAAALARNHARQALERAKSGGASCLLSGGETTVTLGPNPGRGGRNSEYVLALILALDGHGSIWALAADTDGIDGRGGHSGALIGPTTLRRARQLGLDAGDFLRRHDSASLFDRKPLPHAAPASCFHKPFPHKKWAAGAALERGTSNRIRPLRETAHPRSSPPGPTARSARRR